MTAPSSPHVTTSHDGPITPGCPIDCLGTVLSRAAFNLLARAYDAPFDPPRTVSDVLELHKQHKLGEIGGLAPRRIGEIEASLIYAGLVIGNRDRR